MVFRRQRNFRAINQRLIAKAWRVSPIEVKWLGGRYRSIGRRQSGHPAKSTQSCSRSAILFVVLNDGARVASGNPCDLQSSPWFFLLSSCETVNCCFIQDLIFCYRLDGNLFCVWWLSWSFILLLLFWSFSYFLFFFNFKVNHALQSTPTQTPDAKSAVPQYLQSHKKKPSVFFFNQVKQELHYYLSVAPPLALSTNILSPTLSHI